MKNITIALFVPSTSFLYSQSWERIDEIYTKIDCRSCKSENGDDIDYIFKPNSTKLKEGKYQIEITDGKGGLYQIKSTDIYIEFTYFHGYVGYSESGILEVDYYGNARYIKTKD